MTTATTDDFVGGAQNSVNLAGVLIDELLVELDRPPPIGGWEEVDNIRLTQVEAVPAPATAWLLLLGAGLLVGARRR